MKEKQPGKLDLTVLFLFYGLALISQLCVKKDFGVRYMGLGAVVLTYTAAALMTFAATLIARDTLQLSGYIVALAFSGLAFWRWRQAAGREKRGEKRGGMRDHTYYNGDSFIKPYLFPKMDRYEYETFYEPPILIAGGALILLASLVVPILFSVGLLITGSGVAYYALALYGWQLSIAQERDIRDQLIMAEARAKQAEAQNRDYTPPPLQHTAIPPLLAGTIAATEPAVAEDIANSKFKSYSQ